MIISLNATRGGYDTLPSQTPSVTSNLSDPIIIASDIASIAGQRSDQRARYSSDAVQLLFFWLAFILFSRSSYITAQITRKNPNSMVGWCLFMQSLAGIPPSLCRILMALFNQPDCLFFCLTGALCVSIILAWRAHLVYNRSVGLLVLGGLLMLPEPFFGIAFWYKTQVIQTNHTSCELIYPSWLPWLRLAIDVPFNVVFSAIFLFVVLRQYQKYGGKIWKRLQQKGFICLFALLATNTFTLLMTGYLLKEHSIIIWVLDWIITNQILLFQHQDTNHPDLQEFNRKRCHKHKRNCRSIRREEAITQPIDTLIIEI
ncbi:hypothetical protein BDF19DRAFT_429987 [Syncephalis fuscata]|nr:hypothetical protein BDF19DRAFT_429987 [Syncephalis fuscata]